MADRDLIGSRGEWFTQLAFTESMDDGRVLFRPRFLGEKYPTIDLIVELVDARPALTPFFFAQVKATTQGYTPDGELRVQLARDEMRGLIRYPVPTYVVGVDTRRQGRVFLAAALAHGAERFSSMPTIHELNGATLRALYAEVLDFWQTNPVPFAHSRFDVLRDRRLP